MRDNRKEPSKEIPKLLREWLQGAKTKGTALLNKPRIKGWGKKVKGLPASLKEGEFDLKKLEFKNLSEYSGWIRFALLVLGVFLASELTSRVIGLFVRPVYPNLPRKTVEMPRTNTPAEDYDAILRRNIFNVEGKIPDPFDQGRLDCLSQAKASTQRITLLGTIVMSNENLSVALIQDDNSSTKIGVKKDDVFSDGKYQAMKVERKKLCFQVKASQEFEFVEIPDDSAGLSVSSPLVGSGTEGIIPVSETEFQVKQNFLEKNLLNLNEILQTARAVPYVEPGTGRFRGFLIQSIDATSPFSQLGIRQGDVLTTVNDIILDNAGKGLEAFQRLRNSPKISLKVLRGGQETNISYDVKN